MKKCIVLLTLALLLSGCGVEETLETISDEWVVPAMAAPREISVFIPGEADISAFQCDEGRLYIADDYEISIETMESGDLDATIRAVSGYGRDDLTVLRTEAGDAKRYEFTWAAAGEKGERLGRSVILDDGSYHYILTVLRDANPEKISQIVWSQVFKSFALV